MVGYDGGKLAVGPRSRWIKPCGLDRSLRLSSAEGRFVEVEPATFQSRSTSLASVAGSAEAPR
jgi:hypothetical protein